MVPGITSFSYGASGLEYGAMDSRVNIRGLERGILDSHEWGTDEPQWQGRP